VPTRPRLGHLRCHAFHAQGRASTPPPARLVISELNTAASHQPPRATSSSLPLPRLAIHCIDARRLLSNRAAVASRLLPVANPAGRAAPTAINRQARALRARPRPEYRLSPPINSRHRSLSHHAPPNHFPLSLPSSHHHHQCRIGLQSTHCCRSPSTSPSSPRRGQERLPSTSSLRPPPPHSQPPSCPGGPPVARVRAAPDSPLSSVLFVSRGGRWWFCP
jgi:hypothetical protein